ncbi:hypothetical protein ANN_00376 [Periplaneta americana]|uniref:Uncharacterized protein n=1 Tax=Periplaneta americana TaxID=6978 RepID=A0ABQ8TTU4_PERAM|nr:hypothetical protein ANN_00376 [Periplaneta americana]
MAGLCEGGNEPSGSLKVIFNHSIQFRLETISLPACDVILQPPQINGICSQFMCLNLLHLQPEEHVQSIP